MTPNTDERLASVIRALTEVILPHLPPEASLAQEQAQLAIGHLQILRLQLDSVHGFEAEELADTRALAGELVEAIDGGGDTADAADAPSAVLASEGADVRGSLSGLNRAIDPPVRAASSDGPPTPRTRRR